MAEHTSTPRSADAWLRPVERRGTCLTHDLPCAACGHARHTYLACSDTCACQPPLVPGQVA